MNVTVSPTPAARRVGASSAGGLTRLRAVLPLVSRIVAAIKDGAPFDYTYNQAVMDVECLVVPKGSKHKELAMKVINDFVKPDYQADLPKYIPYGPANQKAYDTGKITPEMIKGSVTAPDNLKLQVIMDKPWWAANGQAAQERWDAFIQK